MRTFIRHLNKYIINTSLVVQILSCRWYYHSTCILCVSNCVSVCTGGVGVGLLCRLILSYDPMTRWYTATNTVFKSHLLYTSVKKDFGLETMINLSCAWLTNALFRCKKNILLYIFHSIILEVAISLFKKLSLCPF